MLSVPPEVDPGAGGAEAELASVDMAEDAADEVGPSEFGLVDCQRHNSLAWGPKVLDITFSILMPQELVQSHWVISVLLYN